MSDAFSKLASPIQQALWDKKWQSLRPIQVDAIKGLYDTSNDLVIAAATASGKTEAAFLPLLSQLVEQSPGGIGALCIAPLKALINDQFLRLEELAIHADIPIHRWHGDVSAHLKKAIRAKPSGILFITPESLESCFINYGVTLDRMFGDTRFIVIDELHAFLGDVRGTHLSSLLYRLRALSKKRPRHIGLSATLASFERARAFLNPQDPEAVTLIEDEPGSRSTRIGLRAFPKPVAKPSIEPQENVQVTSENPTPFSKDGPDTGPSPDTPDGLALLTDEIAQVFATKTNLIFVNRRAEAELLVENLACKASAERWSRNPFVVHHGSISKEAREFVEKRLKAGEQLTVFCTSTLEMGIDIGDAYSVGQLGPPWSVASLVQRIGRSGRKTGQSAILRMYSLDAPPRSDSPTAHFLYPQLLQSIALIELMLIKWLEPAPDPSHHLSVLVQQVLSILRQTGGASAAHIYQALCAEGEFQQISTNQFRDLMCSLGANQLIEQMPEGLLILAPDGECLTHDRDFYAAFNSSEDFAIRHREDRVGCLPGNLIPPVGEFFILNGRRWMVEDIESAKRLVHVAPGRGKKKPLFLGKPGSIHDRIPDMMRQILFAETSFQYLHSNSEDELSAARIYVKKHFTGEHFIFSSQRQVFFPWVGSRSLLTLSLFAKCAGISVQQQPFSLVYECDRMALQSHFESILKGLYPAKELVEILPDKHLEKYDHYLPDKLLNDINIIRALDIEGAHKLIASTVALIKEKTEN